MIRRIISNIEVAGDEPIAGDNKPYKQGDALELARFYESAGADELMLYERSNTPQGSDKLLALVEKLASSIFLPLTVAGGIDSISKIKQFIRAGASKVCMNNHALKAPEFIKEAADKVGAQNLILLFQFRKNEDEYEIFSKNCKAPYPDMLEWAKFAQQSVSEIIAHPIVSDPQKEKIDFAIIGNLAQNIEIPLLFMIDEYQISDDNILTLFKQSGVTGIIASNIFHKKESSIKKIKKRLIGEGIAVRQHLDTITRPFGKQTSHLEINLLEKKHDQDIELLNKIEEVSEEDEK